MLIEPFAGSAGYSHRHHAGGVLLTDKDPVIAQLWAWLIATTPETILGLPLVAPGDRLDEMGLADEPKSLIGFWVNKGSAHPCNCLSSGGRKRKRTTEVIWTA